MIPILSGNVASALPSGYDVDNSCRFNGADSAYFSKTPSSNGSQTISTFSAWIKKTVNGSYEGIFTSVYETGEYFEINFEPSDKLEIRSKYSGSYVLRKQTTRVFRDHSSWYHIVVVLDTTNGTAEDRCKVYINGVRETSFSTNTNPGSSQNLGLNATSYEHRVGRDEWSTPAYFDGYMAEVHWIDGTAKAHTDFGEFDSNSPTIWKPKEYTDGGYGTNGFYLDFADSGNLGDDESGNTLDLAENNIAAEDQATDTCTNNFCTLNPLDWSNTGTDIYSILSQGNCLYTSSGAGAGNNSGVGSTIGASKGKWYFEAKTTNTTTGWLGMIYKPVGGNADSNGGIYSSGSAMMYGISTAGEKSINGTGTSSVFTALSANDIMSFAYDLDNGYFYFGVNGTYVTSGNPASGSSGTGAIGAITASHIAEFMRPGINNGNYGASSVLQMNFGGCPSFSISSGNSDANGYGNFEYAVPSGYYSINSKNLAEFG